MLFILPALTSLIVAIAMARILPLITILNLYNMIIYVTVVIETVVKVIRKFHGEMCGQALLELIQHMIVLILAVMQLALRGFTSLFRQ